MPRKRPMQLDDLFRLNALGHVALSPDGKLVAYEVKRFDLQENRNYTRIEVVGTDGSEPRALTDGKHADHHPRWSPDGKSLAFLSDRDKGSTLWVLPMSGGEPRRVTANDGFAKDFAWSPSGKHFAVAWQAMSERELLERDGKTDQIKKAPQFKHITRLFHKLDGAGWWNGQYTHIYSVPAAGGKLKALTSGDYDHSEPTWSPDGKLVSFVSNREENRDVYLEKSDVYVVSPKGGRARRITQKEGSAHAHSWSPDGKWIAFIGDDAPLGKNWTRNSRPWVVPSRGGKPMEVAREVDSDCMNMTLGDVVSAGFEAMSPLWTADSQRIYFQVSVLGATVLCSRSIHKRDLEIELGGDVNILYVHRGVPNGPMVVALGENTNPGDVYLFDPKRRGHAERLTHLNAELFSRIDVVRPEPFSVKSGTATVDGWVMKPPGFRKGRKYPAILEIHGGPHGQYGYAFFHEMQYFAAKGYVVVFSNPRGSTSYGLKHRNCIQADWGNLDYKDCMKVADWLFSRSYVDKKRVGVTGGSYGGYMTNWMVGHTQRFRAAVTQRSVYNMESMFGTSDVGYLFEHEFGGNPWKNVAALRRQSPYAFAKNIKTPLLIEHEEEDHRCPIEQGEQLFTALKLLGREVEMVRFEGESHGLSRGGRPQNRAERLRRIVGWFDRWMK
jgi:dipeptidyl aminopeptidase/acylaminoacyl peptidase